MLHILIDFAYWVLEFPGVKLVLCGAIPFWIVSMFLK